MTDEEINRAIAEACGWKYVNTNKHTWETPDGKREPFHRGIPNYCNDLNAMHEAEKALQNQFTTLDNVRRCLRQATNRTNHQQMKPTTVIGRETPILTYQLFAALAERNERKAQRKAKIERLKSLIMFWKKEAFRMLKFKSISEIAEEIVEKVKNNEVQP